MRRLQSTTAWALLVLASATAANAQPLDHFVFDLPAETLSRALTDVALRTGRNVIAPSDLVEGRAAEPLTGSFTAEEAVGRLLSGSGLSYRSVGGTIVVERVPFEEKGAASGNAETADLAITVTGTRIRGAGSTSPVSVATRSELEEGGISDLVGFARILPQNFTGGQNPGIAGGGEQGGQSNVNNSATLNLRGLGPDATLTLLNGHRLAYDALDQGIDISAIPLGAIERVEVVADGSSALYGSDAVGGVANIILRRDYEGVESTARIGGATSGGDFQQQYSLVGGHRWTSGGFMVALDHSHATPIFAGQRDYARTVDPSLTLTTRNDQSSGVVSAHQQIAPGVSLDVDGYAMDRHSLKQTPFLPTASVFTDGLVSRPKVHSYGLTPTLRIDLGPWQASLSATRAVSRTELDTSNYFNGTPRNSRLIYENRLNGIEANGEGPLFVLPGGDARLALGAGQRRVSLHGNVAKIVGGQVVPSSQFKEARNVQFAYGELSLPLVGSDLKLPAVQRLTVTGALRYERWKGIDAVTTPKVGLIYQPNGIITIRGTWGKSFKAPTLFQVNEPLEGVLLPGFIFTPAPKPPGSTVLLLGGGNPGLKSEHATTWSGTIELKPGMAPGLDLQASYFDIDYRGRIGSPLFGTLTSLGNPLFSDLIVFNPSAAEVNALVASLPQGLSNQTGQPFDPASVGAIIDSSLRNTAHQRIHGLDLSADYRLDFGRAGRLLFTGTASYLHSNQQLAANQPVIPMAGTIFNPPHWRGRAGAIWEGATAGFSALLNYVGSTIDNRFPDNERIGPFVSLDLNASVRTRAETGPFRNIELRLSALNVLNEKPRVIRNSEPEAPPYDSTNQSPVGRFLGLSIRKIW
jgi:iron complex outermembrane recepter protein